MMWIRPERAAPQYTKMGKIGQSKEDLEDIASRIVGNGGRVVIARVVDDFVVADQSFNASDNTLSLTRGPIAVMPDA